MLVAWRSRVCFIALCAGRCSFRLLMPIIDRCVMVRGLVLNCYLALRGCFVNHERGGFHDLPDCIRVMLSYPGTR